MDKGTLFRNLVMGKFMHHFDYALVQLSFQTVFHPTPDDYCCCICSYEHEYIAYISEDGTVDEEMFERVLGNIVKGACPHVASAPSDFITETSVFAIHIASAVGPARAVMKFSTNYLYKRGKIFELDPCHIAILKNRNAHASLFYKARVMGCSLCNSHSYWKKFVLYGTKMEDSDSVKFRYFPVVRYCAGQGNMRLLKTILNAYIAHNPLDIAKLLELTFGNELKSIQTMILKYIGTSKNKKLLVNCCKVAILNDQQDIIPEIFDWMIKSTDDREDEFPRIAISETLSLLQKNVSHTTFYRESEQVLSFGDHIDYRIKELVTLIDAYPRAISQEVLSLFRDVTRQVDIDGAPPDHYKCLIFKYVHNLRSGHSSYCDEGVPYSEKVDALIQLGGDIDFVEDGLTPLSYLLDEKGFEYLTRCRELLEVLIFENSSLENNSLAVSLGIKQASNMHDFQRRTKRLQFPGNFLLDAKVHPLNGHDDASNFALNFAGPLLIECGYPVTRETIEKTLERPLHSAEKEYYEHTLDNPRPLQCQCRDTLRKHFKGRKIHKFVRSVNIPKHIGDMILLKPILRNIHTSENFGDDSGHRFTVRSEC